VVIGKQVFPAVKSMLQEKAKMYQAIAVDADEVSVTRTEIHQHGPDVWEESSIQWTSSEDEGSCGQEVSSPQQKQPHSDPREETCAPRWMLPNVQFKLVGSHQRSNAAVAVRTLLWLRDNKGFAISDANIQAGLQTATLPGRFQVLQADNRAPGGSGLVVLDGAHTPAAAEFLAFTLSEVFKHNSIALVVAMSNDKEHLDILKNLQKVRACTIVFTEVKIAGSRTRSTSADLLLQKWQKATRSGVIDSNTANSCQTSMQVAPTMRDAIFAARLEAGSSGVVCVTGSLHAVAHARLLCTTETIEV